MPHSHQRILYEAAPNQGICLIEKCGTYFSAWESLGLTECPSMEEEPVKNGFDAGQEARVLPLRMLYHRLIISCHTENQGMEPESFLFMVTLNRKPLTKLPSPTPALTVLK